MTALLHAGLRHWMRALQQLSGHQAAVLAGGSVAASDQ